MTPAPGLRERRNRQARKSASPSIGAARPSGAGFQRWMEKQLGNAATAQAVENEEIVQDPETGEIVFLEPLVITGRRPPEQDKPGEINLVEPPVTTAAPSGGVKDERPAVGAEVRRKEGPPGPAAPAPAGTAGAPGAKAAEEEDEEKKKAKQAAPGTPGAAAAPLTAKGAAPPTGPHGAAGPPPAAEGAEEGGAELAIWKSGVNRAINAVPEPNVTGGPEGAAQLQARAKVATGRGATKRASVGPSAKKAVPDSPEPPEKPSVPPEPDPVPEATALVANLPYHPLPDQTLPALQPRVEGGPVPTEGDLGELSAAEGFDADKHNIELAKLREEDAKKKEELKKQKDGAKEDPNKKRAQQIKQKNQKQKNEPPKEPKEKPGQAITIKDEGPPKPRKLPKQDKETVAGVLAQLLANPQPEAEKMLNQAREEAYPDGILARVYPDIGKEDLGPLTDELVRELSLIQKEAGISNELLNKKIEERRKELEKQKAEAEKQPQQAHTGAVDAAVKDGQKSLDTIRGAADQIKIDAEKTLENSAGSDDPKVIEAKRDRLIERIHGMVADKLGLYRNAEKRRGDALDKAGRKQSNAYKDTGEREARKTVRDAGDDTEKQKGALLDAQKIRAWATAQVNKISQTVAKFKKDVSAILTGHRNELTDKGGQATQKIREWADQRTGKQRSWWRKFWDRIMDWFGQSKKIAEKWEESTAQEERDAILQDSADLDGLLEQAKAGVDLSALAAQGKLTRDQLTILNAYFGKGSDRGNKLAALAAAMRIRIFARRRPGIVSKFEDALIAKPDSEWKNLEDIAVKQGGNLNSAKIVQTLYDAMFGGLTGWGTDEDAIFNSLGGLTKLQGVTVRKCYSATYRGRNLDEDLADELSGAEWDRAKAQLEGKQASADAAALYEAMKGGLTGIGTDEEAINKALRGKSDAEREAIIAEYQRMYGRDLKADLKDELSGYELDQSMAYSEGKTAEGDAAGLQHAMKGGLTGGGTDEGAIDATYKQIRNEVKAQADREGWSTARMDAEIRRRNQEVEDAFNQKYGKEYGNPTTSALRVAFEDELSGGELRLANAMADADMAKAEAARLDVEFNSIITDDDAVNEILENQYTRAYEDLKRDRFPGQRAALEIQAEKDRLAGHPWPPEKWRDEERKLDRQIAKDAQAVAQVYTNRMTEEYEKYDFGKGSLRFRLYMTTSGTDRDEALTRLKQGGYLTPVQQVDFAISGLGTKEKLVDKALDGKTPDEMKELKRDWEAKHPGKNFEEEVLDEFSGREAFDYKLKLRGEPQTPEEKLALELERINYELTTYHVPGLFTREQREAMLLRKKEMEEDKAALEKARAAFDKPNLSEEERKRATDQLYRFDSRFNRSVEATHHAVDMHRKQIDAVTDGTVNIVSTVVAIVVAVVVSAAIIVASAGTATPAVIALWAGVASALAAGAATIATKAIMKGKAYGTEELGVDIAVTLVDVAVSAATAGIGDKILKAGKIAAIAGKGIWQQRAMHLLAEGAENLIQALPNAFARNALNDKIWESPNTASMLAEATLAETATSLPISIGAAKALAPLTKFGTNALVGLAGRLGPQSAFTRGMRAAGSTMIGADLTAKTGDFLLHLGTPEQRLALWHDYRLQNPEATFLEFRQDLIDGRVNAMNLEDATRNLHRGMREELLSGIPPGERGLFTETPIRVVSDAEFDRMTGSYSGNAYVRAEDGKLRVIIRESAPIHALGEEGKHLRQSLDPAHAKRFQQLDESRLAKWNELHVDEQLDTLRSKLDLEIEAQKSVIDDLHAGLRGAAGDEEATRKLAGRMQEAEATLGNLEKRLGEVNAIAPDSRLQMARGEINRPGFLEQPPRLFHKGEGGRAELLAGLKTATPDQQGKINELLDNIATRGKSAKETRGLFEHITATAKKLGDNPERAIKFLESADTLLNKTMKKNTAAVQDAVLAAAKATEPDTFLNHVAEISARPGLKDDTFKSLTGLLREASPDPGKALAILEAAAGLISMNPTKAGDASRHPAEILKRLEEFHKAAGDSPEMQKLAKELAQQSDEIVRRNLEAMEAGYPPPPPDNLDGYMYIAEEGGFQLRKVDGGASEFEVVRKDGKIQVQAKEKTRDTFEDRKRKWGEKFSDSTQQNQTTEAVIKKAGMDGLSADDLGPIRNWAEVIGELHAALTAMHGETRADKEIVALLAKLRAEGFTEGAYDRFRHGLREKVADRIIFDKDGKPRPVEEQEKLLKGLLDKQPDNASRGELFSTYREKWMPLDVGEETSAFKVIDDAARRLKGIPDDKVRMVDGAVQVKDDLTIKNAVTGEKGTLEKGRYLIEDKASEAAFKLDQAEQYSELLHAPYDGETPGNRIETSSVGKQPQTAKGVIIVLPDATQAKNVATKIQAAGLHPGVHVAYRGEDGRLKIIR